MKRNLSTCSHVRVSSSRRKPGSNVCSLGKSRTVQGPVLP